MWNDSSQKLILHVSVRIGPTDGYYFVLGYNAVEKFTIMKALLLGHYVREVRHLILLLFCLNLTSKLQKVSLVLFMVKFAWATSEV